MSMAKAAMPIAPIFASFVISISVFYKLFNEFCCLNGLENRLSVFPIFVDGFIHIHFLTISKGDDEGILELG